MGKGSAAPSRGTLSAAEKRTLRMGAPKKKRGSAPDELADIGVVDGLTPSDDPTKPDFAWIAIEAVKPWVNNPRKNAKAVPKVAASIRKWGWGRPLVVNRWPGCEGELIVGHTAWLAALSLKLDVVPVRWRRMEPAAAHALALADNKLGELSDWDPDELGRIVGAGEISATDLSIAGFSAAELRKLQAAGGSSTEDEVPEPPRNPVTRPGDVWLLGEHRLVCGDSLVAAVVELALAGVKPGLALLDPPYGIGRVWKGGFKAGWKKAGKLAAARNEWDSEPPSTDALLKLIGVAKHAVVWGGNYFSLPVSRGWLVWTKPERGFTLSEAELAWTNRDMPVRVFDGARSDPGREHPTQKTVALIAWCLDLFKRPRHILDGFGGAGTTLIAAEQVSRTAYVVEREPGWCDVTVDRWQRLTGGKARRSGESAAA